MNLFGITVDVFCGEGFGEVIDDDIAVDLFGFEEILSYEIIFNRGGAVGTDGTVFIMRVKAHGILMKARGKS